MNFAYIAYTPTFLSGFQRITVCRQYVGNVGNYLIYGFIRLSKALGQKLNGTYHLIKPTYL